MDIPLLVAHRGYAARYPENTLPALEAAVKAGACYVEFDVQMTVDHIPVLFHDDDLSRVADNSARINETRADELKKFSPCETQRFGQTFSSVQIPALAEAAILLKQYNRVTAFVELKETGLQTAGVQTMVDTVMQVLAAVKKQVVLISFRSDALVYARQKHHVPIGWVISQFDDESKQVADKLQPDYLFCNYKKLPRTERPMWPGQWQWCLYEVIDPELALRLAQKGAHMIETMNIGDMLRHPELCKRSCIEQDAL